MYLQKGWKDLVLQSDLETEEIVVLNFFEVDHRTFEITFDVIG